MGPEMPTDYAVRRRFILRLAWISRTSSWSLVTGETHAHTSVKRACLLTYLILLRLCTTDSVQTHRKLQYPPHSIESRRQHSWRVADLSNLLMLDATHTQFNTPDMMLRIFHIFAAGSSPACRWHASSTWRRCYIPSALLAFSSGRYPHLFLILWEYRITLSFHISANKDTIHFTTSRPFRFRLRWTPSAPSSLHASLSILELRFSVQVTPISLFDQA